MPNNLNDVLIRQFMKSFQLTRFEAGLIQSAFYSVFSSGYARRIADASLRLQGRNGRGLCLFGDGNFSLLAGGRSSVSTGSFCWRFYYRSGFAFLETSSNPFIAQLGDPETAAQAFNFSQAFNPIGAISGVLVGTLFIFSGVELSPAQLHR